MFKLKRLISVLVVVLLILGICIQVSAVDNPVDVTNLLQQSNSVTNPDDDTPTTNTPATNTPNINAPSFNTPTNRVNTIIQPDDENTPAVNKLPQTGVTEDITVMFFIIVCAISAIYAYKKIRDYKG